MQPPDFDLDVIRQSVKDQHAIKSVEDLAEKYVPGFNGSEYGKTPIRDLLHMSSGVEFGETKDGQRDLNRLWIDMVLGLGPTKGSTR